MCGLIYCRRFDSGTAHTLVEKRYRRQASRGRDGFGFLVLDEKARARRALTEGKILERLKKESASREILFHHRFPTSTDNLIDATHPILVSHTSLQYDYYLAHNGVISNDWELRREHLALGFVYRTEVITTVQTRNQKETRVTYNDSETLAIDFARTIEGQQESMKATGSIAFIAIRLEKKTRKPLMLYYGHNAGSPLTIERQRDFLAITSEGGTPLVTNMLYSHDYATGEDNERTFMVGTYHTPSVGFGASYNNKTEGLPSFDFGTAYGNDYAGFTRPELEMELDYLGEELADTERAIKLAREANEKDELAAAEWRADELKDGIEDIEAQLKMRKKYG